MARMRVYADSQPPLVIDVDRARANLATLGKYNASYSSSTLLFEWVSIGVRVGGFVALIWWPWWVPILGLIVGRIISKSAKESCADFAKDIVRENPLGALELSRLGVVLPDVPKNATAV